MASWPAAQASGDVRDPEARRLDEALVAWMATAPPGFVCEGGELASRYGLAPAAAAEHERRFEHLALALFAHQYERVPVYRAFAQRLGRTPSRVRCAAEVPPLPVEAFKRARIAAFPPECEVARFVTSGTSGDAPGTLHLDTLALTDAALERGFRHHVLPDVERMRMLLLVPPLEEAPHSSLGYMLERVRLRWGAPGSEHLVRAGQLQWCELRAALLEAKASCEPLCLLGTAFAWVHVLERCASERFEVELPSGSRLLETGGFKGRSRVLERAELVAEIGRRLGLPAEHVVSEYGMTEMGSQMYTLGLRRALLRQPSGDDAWSFPAWLRPRILDAETGRCGELGSARQAGLLVHHDLANRGSVAQLLTADLGRPRGCSFELLGRAPRAEARGCGLVHERWGMPSSRDRADAEE